MRSDDILKAIGDVDETYVKKAHRKSFLTALLVFLVIVLGLGTLVLWQVPDMHLLLRFQPDGSVLTGYVDPEDILYDRWTSMEYTAYAAGEPVSTTQFRIALSPNYTITHEEKGVTTRIVGTNGDPLWPNDYLGSRKNRDNVYLSTVYGADLLDRIDRIAINTGVAHETPGQCLNFLELSYYERGEVLHRQTQLVDGGTTEERVVGSRGYDTQNGRVCGWKEWDVEENLLAYAQYTYDGNVQTVATYSSDGTLTGTRVARYRFGQLQKRTYYDGAGNLVGEAVFRYRPWEMLLCVEGIVAIVGILSLAATLALAVWEDRFQLGTRLMHRSVAGSSQEIGMLLRELKAVKSQMVALNQKQAASDMTEEDIRQLTAQLETLNAHLEQLLNASPGDE